MITQQKASVLPAHIFKNISLGVIVCSLTTQLFLIKSLLCCVFWNQGAAMPNSVEKGTAVLWLKSSQLKLCFCLEKRKEKNLKHREGCSWREPRRRASPGGSLAARVCTRGLARQARPAGVIGGGRSAPRAPPWRPWAPAGLVSPQTPTVTFSPREPPAGSPTSPASLSMALWPHGQLVAPKPFVDLDAP